MAYLVCSEDEICGCCLYRDDVDFITIRRLYIERNYRRQGWEW
ncbi:MAG TPA: hypothetical protein VF326_11325 [Anaerolineaceae bacterium]